MNAGTLGLGVAFVAGLLSFLSPCVLPLVPSYVTFVTGVGLDDLSRDDRSGRERRTVLLHACLFVLGFSLVFVVLGASATLLGSMFRFYSRWLEVAGGTLLVVFGAHLLGLLRIPGAAREWRVHLADKPVGRMGSVLVGVAFGAGWTPCIGPVLGGILTLAATRGSVGEGVGLLAVYSLGLAVPYLLAALLLDRFVGTMRRARPMLRWVERGSGVLLVLTGVLLLSGSFGLLTAALAPLTPTALRNWI